MTTTTTVNINPLRVRQEEREPQHNLQLTVRIRDIKQSYGRGTAILFKGDDVFTSLDRLAKWITDAMYSGGTP